MNPLRFPCWPWVRCVRPKCLHGLHSPNAFSWRLYIQADKSVFSTVCLSVTLRCVELFLLLAHCPEAFLKMAVPQTKQRSCKYRKRYFATFSSSKELSVAVHTCSLASLYTSSFNRDVHKSDNGIFKLWWKDGIAYWLPTTCMGLSRQQAYCLKQYYYFKKCLIPRQII